MRWLGLVTIGMLTVVTVTLSGCGGGGGGGTPAVQSCAAYANQGYPVNGGAVVPGAYPHGIHGAHGYNATQQYRLYDGRIVNCVGGAGFYGQYDGLFNQNSLYSQSGFRPLGVAGNCSAYSMVDGRPWQAVAFPGGSLACVAPNYLPTGFSPLQYTYYTPAGLPVMAYQSCGVGIASGCSCRRPYYNRGVVGVGFAIPGLQINAGFCI